MQYGTDHAELYDVVFRSRGKDFAAEVNALTDLVRAHKPDAGTLLDVACGTGAHLEAFRSSFGEVAGLERSDAMREIARTKLPGVALHPGDMRRFDLGRTFDAVVCLGNSVACMPTTADLDAAIARMTAHLVPGGVLVAEPWWFPADFIDGYIDGHLVKEDGRVISRLTRSTRHGRVTRMEVGFTIAEPAQIRTFSEVLQVTLFEYDNYLAAFERAGCTTELIPALALANGRPNSPGLFVGVRT